MFRKFLKISTFILILIQAGQNVLFAATNSWDFSTGSDYTFTATDIEVTGGNAQLKMKADWNDSSWLRRKPIVIDNTGNSTSFTNIQVKVVVAYDSDMQADFDDIRFTDSDGQTDLDFWLEEKVDSSSATFWVEIPTLTGSSSKTIYLYYENDLAVSASNGASTFVEFDDFTTSTADHQFAFGSDSGYMAAFNPTDRRFYFLGTQTNNLTDYNVTTWANIDNWEVGFSYPSTSFANSSVIWHPTKQLFYLYGGTDGNSTTLSSIYTFDPVTNTIALLSETLPQGVVNPGAVYNPVNDKVYLFGGRRTFTGGTSTFSNTIYTHNLDLVTPTVTNTTAILPIASEGMEPVYSNEDGKIYLFGGAYRNSSTLNSLTTILSYDPASPSTNPVDTGSDLPTPRDTMGTAYANGNVYIFGGYNWTNSTYYNTVYKYDISSNTLTTLAATIPHADDDMKAFYDSVNDRIYVGPLLHSSAVSNEDSRKVLILEFNPNTEEFTPEPSLGTTPSGWTSSGTDSVDIPRSIGGNLVLSDHSTTTYVAVQKTITALSGVKMVEYKVDVPNSNSNIQFYITPAVFNFFTTGASLIRNYATTSWQLATAGSTNQAITTIQKNKHIIGHLMDVPNAKNYGLVNRANRTSAFDWITNNQPLVKLEINTPSTTSANGSGTGAVMIDWMIVRNTTTGVEPVPTVGSEEGLYLSTNPAITANIPFDFTSISAFSETATKNGGEVKYQISNDGGVTWYWYSSGWTSTVFGYSESNTGSEIDTNITSFPRGDGSFLFKAYLHSDGAQLVQLNNIEITYLNDTNVPVRSLGSPSGVQASGTLSTIISLSTDENATCKFGTSSGTAYASIPGTFSTTGGTSHSETVSGLSDGNTYTYYIRCEDTLGNANTDDYSISFSVDSPAPEESSGSSSSSSGSMPRRIPYALNTSRTIEDTPPTFFMKDFGVGSIDPEVLKLQNYLIKKTFLGKNLNTGYFGPMTKQALIQYQKANDIIPSTGYFGPATKKLINRELGLGSSEVSPVFSATTENVVFVSPLKFGSRGEEVIALQKLLSSLPDVYPEGKITGYYGVATKSAVEKFQLLYKVVSSSKDAGFGTVGPKTRDMLNTVFSKNN